MNDKKGKNNANSTFVFGRENYIMMIAGLVIILIGFLLMTGGRSDDPMVFNPDEVYSFRRVTLAPIVVLIGYIVEIFAIFRKPRIAD